ncbi:Fic family protein [Nevskia sp.]|uniref:Fic family protein n=1 Tax=Nevskia sp. TaxID=1929292 RepID=UPI0025D977DA|nr:Fic family protein [Nevskia sp.]
MTAPRSFHPLMPEARVLGPLLEQAAALIRESHALAAQAGPGLAASLAPRLRAMNSYYTNKIEGQHTRPADIDLALAQQWSGDHREAVKQRLAIAHMDAELALEGSADSAAAYSPDRVREIHAALYSRVPEAERLSDDGRIIVPGAWRDDARAVGQHLAPPPDEVLRLLAEWSRAYSGLQGLELPLIGVACAHQRLNWVHPFIDGNGRSARLHSHLVLHGLGLTQGLWSPMRGLARSHERYYALLNNADLPRRNDLDGRGPLSQEELLAFAGFFLDVCLDQARFIGTLLQLRSLRERIADLLNYLAARPWSFGSEKSTIRMDALEALHYTAITGPVERARFMAMTGLEARTARRVLATLLDYGVLASTSSRAPVAFAVPLSSLRFLFPRLWPEAEID